MELDTQASTTHEIPKILGMEPINKLKEEHMQTNHQHNYCSFLVNLNQTNYKYY